MATKRRWAAIRWVHSVWGWLGGRWEQLLLPVGALVLIVGVVLAVPGWWGRHMSAIVVGAARHWLLVVLFGVGGASLVWSAVRGVRRRWRPGRVRRARREPVAVWLPLSVHIGGLLVTAVAVAVGMGSLLWWALGKPPVGALPSTSTVGSGASAWTVSNTFDAMKIVLSVVAGIGAVVALTVAYRKQDQGEAAEHREETKLFNDRFGKAADQLGSDKAAVRLAGVYAMAGLAGDWREGRQTCIDVLCAYVRMPWPESPSDADATPAGGEHTGETPAMTARELAEERQVRHAIVRVIRDHLRPGKPGDVDRWYRHHFDFSGAEFHGGDLSGIEVTEETTVDFSGATFALGTINFGVATFSGGLVDFSGATFSGGRVHFSRATFSDGTVDFGVATFSGGLVDFGRATFSGGTVDFGGATFSGGTVGFVGASFSGGTVGFDGASFSGGTAGFAGASFSGGTVGFAGASVSGGTVDFRGARFSGAVVDFDSATFSGGTVDFGHAKFSGGTVDFEVASFSGAMVDFTRAMFSGAMVDFDRAMFSGGTVDFDRAKFSGGRVDFDRAMFSGGTVDFDCATFSGGRVDFSTAKDWSVPPTGLPDASAFVALPQGAAVDQQG